jgi:hypothetical protein
MSSHPRLSAIIGEELEELPIDEEAGSLKQEPFVRVCLVRDAASVADALDGEDIEDDDLDFLAEQAGLIISLEKSGVVNVRYFHDEDELEDRWDDLCDDLEHDAPPDSEPDTENDDDEEE